MPRRYHVSTYRPPTCSNPRCREFGRMIPIDQKNVPTMKIGESWRTFCTGCGTGAGWTLNKVEWFMDGPFDEVVLTAKMQLVPDTVCPACKKIAIIEDAGCCGECAKEIFF
jgi:hypothetical protein